MYEIVKRYELTKDFIEKILNEYLTERYSNMLYGITNEKDVEYYINKEYNQLMYLTRYASEILIKITKDINNELGKITEDLGDIYFRDTKILDMSVTDSLYGNKITYWKIAVEFTDNKYNEVVFEGIIK